jgi:hypothetical protein
MIVNSVISLATKLQPTIRRGWERHDKAVRDLTFPSSYKLAYANVQEKRNEQPREAGILSKAIDFVNKMTGEPAFMGGADRDAKITDLEGRMEEVQVQIFDATDKASKGDKSAEAELNVLDK